MEGAHLLVTMPEQLQIAVELDRLRSVVFDIVETLDVLRGTKVLVQLMPGVRDVLSEVLQLCRAVLARLDALEDRHCLRKGSAI